MRSRFSHFIILDKALASEHLVDSGIASPPWRWLLNLGIAFVVSGLVAIAIPQFVTYALNTIFGVLLFIIGISTAAYALWSRSFSHDFWPWLSSAIFILCGVLLIFNPKIGAVSITLIIALFLLISGIGKIGMAGIVRPDKTWNWIFVSGVIDLVLCTLIFMNMNQVSAWLLGILLGISLCVQGLWHIRLALNLRKRFAATYTI
ncbi:MAG: hypothetical protein HKN88_09015 [Gammaproteobacteria bacterium]|nr:DUF308 domain-containing protein [Gammaproteobacteria bacterium]NNC98195.1 hypothetical protein [Gammaproteobacteria bacterium]NNM14857.1 hypothetical protein [Gammaproteobacteria bacterium]